MRDAGVFRMFVPPSLGGLDLDLLTSVDALAELAKGDPSASWVVMILGAADLVAGRLSEQAQREIYAGGPDTHVCVVLTPHSTARRVDGGWRLTGEWFPASGCLHARWGLFGFPLAEGEAGIAAIPVEELRIKDTWHTTGMRATGSNLVEGQDVFVPDHRVLNLGEAITGSSLRRASARSRSPPTSARATPRRSRSRSPRPPPRSTWPGCSLVRGGPRRSLRTTRPAPGTACTRLTPCSSAVRRWISATR